MRPASRSLRMTWRERLLAGYVTGPLGHFVAGVTDLALAAGRILLARARASLRGRRPAQRRSE